MKKFIEIVENVLDKCFLVEMPIGVSSKEVWVDSIVRRLVYNRTDTPTSIRNAKLATTSSTKEVTEKEGSRYYFDTIAKSLTDKIYKGLKTLGLKTKEEILDNLDNLINTTNITEPNIVEQIKGNIVLGLQTEDKITDNFFVDIIVKDVCNFLFDKIFSENTDLQGFSNYDDESTPETPNYIGYPDSVEEYGDLINTYLSEALNQTCLKLKINFVPNKNILKYTVRVIKLTDSEMTRDFPMQYTGMARGTKDTGLTLQQRVAIAGETSNKGIKSNIDEVNKFNDATFSFTSSTEGLNDREQEVLNSLIDALPNKDSIEGKELTKINRAQRFLPDNKSLFAFINKLVNKGIVKRAESTVSQTSDWSKGGNKPKSKYDDDDISLLF